VSTGLIAESAQPFDPIDLALDLVPVRPRRAISVRPAPRREPPFDDEQRDEPGGAPVRLATATEPQLPLEFRPAPGPVHPTWTHRPTHFHQQLDLPDPGGWARRLLVAVLEVRAGLRPARQLSGYLSTGVYDGLLRGLDRVPVEADGQRQATITSIHVFEPAPAVAEVSAVVRSGARYRALAARLEGHDGHWRCVRLQIG